MHEQKLLEVSVNQEALEVAAKKAHAEAVRSSRSRSRPISTRCAR